MKIKEVVEALERFAPLPLQEDYDNAGLQIGLTEAEASGVLVCLDVTEDVILEAERCGCNLIVAHHPLLFRGVKCLADRNLVERCVREAIVRNIAIYAAHTNLDNARGGVNFEMAERLGLIETGFLQQGATSTNGTEQGSGLIGTLPQEEDPLTFLQRVKETFGVACLNYSKGPEHSIKRVALCGGAGEFLLEKAVAAGADVFLTGEMGYHRYFGHGKDLWIGVLGHYQSERFTVDLLLRLLKDACPGLRLNKSQTETNPIHYL